MHRLGVLKSKFKPILMAAFFDVGESDSLQESGAGLVVVCDVCSDGLSPFSEEPIGTHRQWKCKSEDAGAGLL